ncbi:MAG: trigger factor [Pseudomonadota bacterium]
MQFTVEATEGLMRRMAVEIPAVQIDEEVERRLKDLGRQVRMDGFRPGKAPAHVVRQRYLGQVRQDVVGDVIERSYGSVIQQQQIRPAGYPQIESVVSEPGKDLSFVASFEVYPEVVVGDMTAIEIERPQAEVTEADIDRMIDTLRTQRAEWKSVKHKAKKGERVTVNFKGTLDGEAFAGGSGEGMTVVLGEGRLLKDFEDGLLGIKSDETKTIDVSFPEDYPAENLRGKTAQFEITATDVAERVLPEVDDVFAQAFGSENPEALRADVRKNMERELKQAVRRQLKAKVLDGLVKVTDLAVPRALVAEESTRLREQFASQMRGGQADEIELEAFFPEGERRVKLGLIVAELVKQENLRVDEARVDELLNDIAATYEEPEQVIAYYRANRELMMNVQTLAIEDQVVELVLGKAKVTDVPTAFDDVINPKSAAAA